MALELRIPFSGRVLLLGCGSVSQCFQPLALRHLEMDFSKFTVMDFEDLRDAIPDTLAAGANYVQQRVTPENLPSLLAQHLGPGDLLIDLAWNIDCAAIVQWCHDNDVLYVNTATEVWDPYEDVASVPPSERTLYVRHLELRKLRDSWSRPGPTAVIEHGANPGLVSHWTKASLLDIATAMLERELPSETARRSALERALADEDFARLAMHTGTKVIHISERDTQIPDRPKEVDEFVNTWSVSGFHEEGIAPAEMGWGTHERRLPRFAERARLRPRQPDLPGADGGQHLRPILGSTRRRDHRHGRPPRRGVHDQRPPHRLGGRQAGLPPDGPLRLPPHRRGDRLAARAEDARPRAAAEAADHERRDHRRTGTSWACCSWATT